MLDKKDQLLLAALKKNARASLVSLARDIDLSRTATHDRITRLEETGVIKGYTIIVDEQQHDLTRAFLTLTFEPGKGNQDFTEILIAKPGVETTYCLAGDIDMMVYCECATPLDLSMLRNEIAAMDGLQAVSTRHVLIKTTPA